MSWRSRILLGCLALAGCGYQFVGAAGPLGGIESVAIRTPRNDSFEPGVEYLVADALRRELLRRGSADLSEDPEGADLVVTGSVRPLQVVPRSFSSVVLVFEYEVTMTVDLVARRRDGSELPVEERALRESERFLASADVEVQRKNRQEALRRLSQVVAARFFDSIAEVSLQ
ncbi:MAG: LPS assembly lipoprotein LptE [Myxococcales bacterium]|nr:LPS assembly lipoprotein LptE [Myxococcales bacterium]MDH5566626.1 LPS assembly lipoprotein LptE [Myxococcales bacterium]